METFIFVLPLIITTLLAFVNGKYYDLKGRYLFRGFKWFFIALCVLFAGWYLYSTLTLAPLLAPFSIFFALVQIAVAVYIEIYAP